jgi:RNA polymerase sigma factor (sigma-70 family)
MKTQTDERLARRAARADERAFAAIFRRYNQEIYRFCLSILGNAEDARDAMQNTMVKALQALPGEEREIKLRPWLYRVAHNQSIDLLRRRHEVANIDPDLAAPGDGLTEIAAQRERLRQLLWDLADLPERQRAALLMRELGGLEFTQIGEVFETSPAVARQTVYEARVSLRGLEEGREMRCEEVMHRLSNADGRVSRRRDLRAHLRACPDCRAFQEAIETRRHDFAALAPLPAIASVGILHAILGGAPGAASGAAGASGVTVAVGAGKAVSASLVAKSVATVAVVAAVGVSAGDRAGLIDTHLPGSDSGSAVPAQQASSDEEGGAAGATGYPAGAQAGQGEDDRADGKKASQAKKDGDKAKGKSAATGTGAGNAPGDPGAASPHGHETAAPHSGGASQGHRGSGHGASSTNSSRHGHRGHSKGKSSSRRRRTHSPPKAPKKPAQQGSVQSPSQPPPTTSKSSSSGEGEPKAAQTSAETSP